MLLTGGLLSGACTETTGPPAETHPEASVDGTPHRLVWAAPAHERTFTVTVQREAADGEESVTFVLDALAAERNAVRFWAVRGVTHRLRIDYRHGDGATGRFLALRLPSEALVRRPDGSPLATGDSVLIQVGIDRTVLGVRLEPVGLPINARAPVTLRLWYGGAKRDLNGDGRVDQADAEIRRQLRLEGSEESRRRSPEERGVDGELILFGGHAISW